MSSYFQFILSWINISIDCKVDFVGWNAVKILIFNFQGEIGNMNKIRWQFQLLK